MLRRLSRRLGADSDYARAVTVAAFAWKGREDGQRGWHRLSDPREGTIFHGPRALLLVFSHGQAGSQLKVLDDSVRGVATHSVEEHRAGHAFVLQHRLRTYCNALDYAHALESLSSAFLAFSTLFLL
jgi:hypothetical protein